MFCPARPVASRTGIPPSASSARRLAGPRAAWRRAPISDEQRALLARLRIPIPDDATKGEASDLIALHHGARRLERLAARRAA